MDDHSIYHITRLVRGNDDTFRNQAFCVCGRNFIGYGDSDHTSLMDATTLGSNHVREKLQQADDKARGYTPSDAEQSAITKLARIERIMASTKYHWETGGRPTLHTIATDLGQSGGEGWSIGTMVEDLMTMWTEEVTLVLEE